MLALLSKCIICLLLVGEICAFGTDKTVYPLIMSGSNPSTTMTLRLIELLEDENKPAELLKVYWRKEGDRGWLSLDVLSSIWHEGKARVYSAELQDLSPATRYEIKIGENQTCHFMTSPDPDHNAVKVVVGAGFYNIYDVTRFRRMCATVAKLEPNIVIGGGSFICKGSAEGVPTQWLQFIKMWTELMRTAAGDLIPLDPIIGCRDLDTAESAAKITKSKYYQIFGPKHLAHALSIGRSAKFMMLDTGVVSPIEGAQTTVLGKALMESRGVPYKFAVYSVPVDGDHVRARADSIQRLWLPLFESNGVAAVFESSLNCLSRSWPLLRAQRHLNGIVYCAIGCWGDLPKSPVKQKEQALFPFSESVNGVWLLEIMRQGCVLRAIDIDGQERSRCSLKPRTAAHSPSIGVVQPLTNSNTPDSRHAPTIMHGHKQNNK